MKITIKLDGKDYEVEAGSAEHLTLQARADAARDAALAAEAKKSEALAARADAAEARVKTLEAELAAAPAKVAASIAARSELEANARKVLGAEAKFDGKSDRDIRVAVIVKQDPAFKAEGRADSYVEARFDAELAHVGTNPAAPIGAAFAGSDGRADAFDYDTTVSKHQSAARDLWKTPVAKA